MIQQAWTVRALTETAQSSLSVEQMQALNDAAIKQCADTNGLITDARECKFDPASLQCPRSGGVCLSSDQVVAVRKIYAGPGTSSGQQIAPGFARGSERGWENLYGSVKADGTAGGGSWLGVFRYMLFKDSAWVLPRLDFDRDASMAKRMLGPLLDADSGNLSEFAKRGGRLLIYHGWADQQVPAEMSTNYRTSAIARSAAHEVDSYLRLFMVPGMAHCAPESVPPGAPAPAGPNLMFQVQYEPGVALTPQNDALTAVQEWVENGRAPSQFVVRVRNESGGITARTIRVCAEPTKARYAGEGDPLDARNWSCEGS
jgi:feruloyl esterase